MKHKYVKSYDKKNKCYVNRCVVCGKVVSYPYRLDKPPLWCRIKHKVQLRMKPSRMFSCYWCLKPCERCKDCQYNLSFFS